jgi:phosphoheptose isomerase
MDKIAEIWNELLEVAKGLPRLASPVSSAVDIIGSSLASGGQLLLAGILRQSETITDINVYLPARVSAHGQPGDVLLAISTSGNHHNTLRAIKVARERKVTVIWLTGDSGTNENRTRPLSIGPLQIKGWDSGNAHLHRSHDVEAS